MENLGTNTLAPKHWYMSVLLGILFLAAGIYTLFQPLEAYLTLAMLFGILFLASGIFEIFASFSAKNKNWGLLFLFGVINTIIGFILISNLSIDMFFLPIYVGIVIIFQSFSRINYYSALKDKGIKGAGSMQILSILGIILGALFIISPKFGALNIIILTGLSFIFLGILSIVLGFTFKKVN